MTEFYKLIFDLSLYTTITGYFLRLTAKELPSGVLFLALCAAVALDALLRARELRRGALRFLPLLLPLLGLLSRPSLWQCVQALPAYAYLCFSFLSGRFEIYYDQFRSHYGFGLKLLLALVLGPLFPTEFGAAIVGVIPFLVLMLVCGVCLLRMLREQRREGLRQGLYLAAFVAICAGLTLGRAPQLLLKGAGFVYQNVLAPLIFAVAIALAAVFYVFYLITRWLVQRRQGSSEELNINLQGAAEMLGLEEEYEQYAADLRWLKALIIAVGIALLVFFLLLLFRRLLGSRGATKPPLPFRDVRSAALGSAGTPNPGRIRPRDPRLAVRWYYARFLAECRKRGVPLSTGMTAEELSLRALTAFPGADPAALSSLYRPARYQLSRRVTPEEARAAAAAWNALRRTESPEAAKKKKNKP